MVKWIDTDLMIQFHHKWINLPCLRNSESRYSYSSLEPKPDLQVYRITSTSTSNRSGMYTVYNIYIYIYTRRVFRNAEKNNPAVEIESRNKYVINSCVEQRYRNAKIRSARAIEFTRISVGYNGGRINDYRAYFISGRLSSALRTPTAPRTLIRPICSRSPGRFQRQNMLAAIFPVRRFVKGANYKKGRGTY